MLSNRLFRAAYGVRSTPVVRMARTYSTKASKVAEEKKSIDVDVSKSEHEKDNHKEAEEKYKTFVISSKAPKSKVTTKVASPDGFELVFDEPSELDKRGKEKGMTPLHGLLGTLAACETATARFHAAQQKLDIGEIKFKKVEGTINSRAFVGTEKDVQPYFLNVNVEAEIDTSIGQDKLNEFKEVVEKHCPVYTLLKAAKVDIKSTWTVKQQKESKKLKEKK
ncbi:hydroperoxide reductase [Acrasis kona]|uniref:Hydroperoxide reductase n=1 Tax=Acrasis kona TaxID=1008807 RepID=A0AAW2ZM98_9EUKA